MVKCAVAFGLNYVGTGLSELAGCANDARELCGYLASRGFEVTALTDATDTTACRMLTHVYALAIRSWARRDVEVAWIHFSGHGLATDDANTLLGSDGVGVSDVLLHDAVASFHPDTRIMFTCDACHSGTVLNLNHDNDRVIVQLSACTDAQLDADAWDASTASYRGALTSALLTCLPSSRTIVDLHARVSDDIRSRGFLQTATLATSFEVTPETPLPW